MNTIVRIRPLARIASMILAAMTLTLTAMSCVTLEYAYAAFSIACLLVVILPLALQRTYDLFSPWTFIILAVFVGTTIPGICLSLGWPNDRFLDDTFLRGEITEYFLVPGCWLVLGIIGLTLGYHLGSGLYVPIRLPLAFNRQRLYLVATGCLAISAASLIYYVRFTGGAGSDQLTAKRTTIRELDVGRDKDFSQFGYLRWGASIGLLGACLLLGQMLLRRTSVNPLTLGLLGCLLLSAFAFPFYSSSRGPIAWMFFIVLGMIYYGTGRVPKVMFLSVIISGFVVMQVMSALRNQNEVRSALQVGMQPSESFGRLFLNRGGSDIAKVGHIINRMPEFTGYQYGKTLAVWLIAPIPRELLPHKPLVHSGPIIGNAIYGSRVSGVPPGLIAELFWNFHALGILFGCPVLGYLVRSIYESLRRASGDQGIIAAVYAYGWMSTGFDLLTNSIGFSIILKLIDLVTILGVVWLATLATAERRTVTEFIPTFARRHRVGGASGT
jgi:oligosaccharide repeat unit polymerase